MTPCFDAEEALDSEKRPRRGVMAGLNLAQPGPLKAADAPLHQTPGATQLPGPPPPTLVCFLLPPR